MRPMSHWTLRLIFLRELRRRSRSLWFGASKDRKPVHTETEKQVLGK